MITRKEVAAVLTVGPEPAPYSALDEAAFGEVPAAPWICQIEGVLWLHRASRAASTAIPDVLRSRATLPITLGAFLSYVESPVGPYPEVFGVPRLFPAVGLRAHVPFIAVGSAPSVRGGRANWALPKVLASFKGMPFNPDTPISAAGEGWWIRATPIAKGPRFPLRLPNSGVQGRPNGQILDCTGSFRGHACLAHVKVEVAPASSIAAWLVSGWHFGLVVDGRLVLEPAPRYRPRRSRSAVLMASRMFVTSGRASTPAHLGRGRHGVDRDKPARNVASGVRGNARAPYIDAAASSWRTAIPIAPAMGGASRVGPISVADA